MATWMYTGSHSMFSEAIHSLADTCNQLILAYGIHKSVQVCLSWLGGQTALAKGGFLNIF